MLADIDTRNVLRAIFQAFRGQNLVSSTEEESQSIRGKIQIRIFLGSPKDHKTNFWMSSKLSLHSQEYEEWSYAMNSKLVIQPMPVI